MEKKRIFVIILIIFVFIISIILSLMYYNDKYTVSFETGVEEDILPQYIKRNNKILEPNPPEKEGYVFVEWQLNGQKYDFDSLVNEDIILTAKWLKEDYVTIKYETNSIYNIESGRILKGSYISNLPVAYKDGYEFIGWYINDKLYNNEIINDDVTLIAEYKNNEINTTYKIGDKVIIMGNYSSSAFSLNAYYSKAIGWDRKILNYIENSNYPYVIGNEEGITGFFKASSIEKVIKGE